MIYSAIAALSKNGVIGDGDDIPWNIPEDLKIFKKLTMGKACIVGRKTWETLPELNGRHLFVVSRRPGFYSLDEALRSAARFTENRKLDEVMIIGGAQIYEQTLDLVDKMYLTRVGKEVAGNAFFPPWDKYEWFRKHYKPVLADCKVIHETWVRR